MRIAIGCDPNAETEKREIIDFVRKNNLGEIVDFGDDDQIYANVAIKVAEEVSVGNFDRGILLCGTGIGMSIAANKVKGVFAALVSDVYSAERAILSNDANIITMGAFTTGKKNREMMVAAFLKNEFVNGCGSQLKVDRYHEYDSQR